MVRLVNKIAEKIDHGMSEMAAMIHKAEDRRRPKEYVKNRRIGVINCLLLSPAEHGTHAKTYCSWRFMNPSFCLVREGPATRQEACDPCEGWICQVVLFRATPV